MSNCFGIIIRNSLYIGHLLHYIRSCAVSVHRRFKTACSATSRQMVAELRHLIEARILELENEIGSVGQG